ncbi:hypothetical protein BDV18DRAFT_52425 [Aspergillus unguis]
MSVALGFFPRFPPARLVGKTCLQRRARCPARRWAGTKANEAVANRSLACTWLTATPEQLSPDDILSNFPIAASELTPDYISIFLFTPCLSRWAEAQSPFFERCLKRIYSKNLDQQSHEPIHAVTAIVDRLPNRDGSALRGASELEGVSILLVKRDSVQGRAAARRQVRAVETEAPTLVFSFGNDVANHQDIRQSPHEIGLRLANTIFLNGKDNTLFGTQWSCDSSLRELKLDGSTDLSACSVAVDTSSLRSSLELPLHPVGERRKVITSMGNILRQIAKHSDGRSDEAMPASSELEKELPRYIAENDIADQRISVWALVEKSAESPYTKEKHSQSSLAESIRRGAKLHRVMSGGGGWGKKQGLLSLDPEMSFGKFDDESIEPLHQVLSNNEVSTHKVDTPLELPPFMQDLSTLSQAAEPGDYIQFFASVEKPGMHTHSRDPTHSSESFSCSFGVMSDTDTSPSQRTQHKDVLVVPNYFGALSEKAITYSQPLAESRMEPSETRTKIDVPGSRVALVLK